LTQDKAREERKAIRAALKAEPQWYLVQTLPQGERKAVAELHRAGFRAYLPKRAVYKRRRDGKLPVKRWPAMHGYVFMKPQGHPDWNRFHRCQGVRGVVFLDGQPYRIPQSQIAAIMRAQRSMSYDAPNARSIRQAWVRGEKNTRRALNASRFSIGAKVYDAATMVMARVLEVTKKGTVKALIESKERDVPIEFTDTESLQLIDA
jgi:transcription antitermination factor NusG